MNSEYSKLTIFGFIGLTFFGFVFIAFGLFIYIYVGDLTSGLMFFGSLIFLWLGFFLSWITLNSIKSISIDNKCIVIKKMFSSKKMTLHLDNISYHDYFHIGYKSGVRKGIIIKSSNNNFELIDEKTYSNSLEIINYIKSYCKVDRSIKPPSMSLFFKMQLLTGLVIFVLYMIFRAIE